MRFIPARIGAPAVLELTRRNLTTLLSELDDPQAGRVLISPGSRCILSAVNSDEERDASLGQVAAASGPQFATVTRSELTFLLAGLDHRAVANTSVSLAGGVIVQAVSDQSHYRDRPPGNSRHAGP